MQVAPTLDNLKSWATNFFLPHEVIRTCEQTSTIEPAKRFKIQGPVDSVVSRHTLARRSFKLGPDSPRPKLASGPVAEGVKKGMNVGASSKSL